MKTDKFGFVYKDYDIFKQYCKNSSIPKFDNDFNKLPKMNNIHDYATWVVKQYINDIGVEEFKRKAEEIRDFKIS